MKMGAKIKMREGKRKWEKRERENEREKGKESQLDSFLFLFKLCSVNNLHFWEREKDVSVLSHTKWDDEWRERGRERNKVTREREGEGERTRTLMKEGRQKKRKDECFLLIIIFNLMLLKSYNLERKKRMRASTFFIPLLPFLPLYLYSLFALPSLDSFLLISFSL